jgi:hypothetical protein
MPKIPTMKTRKQLIAEARRQRKELTQYFNDVRHWNNTRGKTEGIIDPDPDGSMGRMAQALDDMLAAEATPNKQAEPCRDN